MRKELEMDEVYIGVKNWWSYLIRGLVAIAIAVVLLAWPASTIKVLTYIFGILLLVEGLIETIWALVLLFQKEKMGILLAGGLVSIFIGLLLLFKTHFALSVVVLLIAIWAIVAGIVEFIASIAAPHAMPGRALVGIAGVVSIIFGILLLALPAQTIYAIIVIISIYLIISGILHIILSFYARKFQKELTA